MATDTDKLAMLEARLAKLEKMMEKRKEKPVKGALSMDDDEEDEEEDDD